jgi:hypothetical protein
LLWFVRLQVVVVVVAAAAAAVCLQLTLSVCLHSLSAFNCSPSTVCLLPLSIEVCGLYTLHCGAVQQQLHEKTTSLVASLKDAIAEDVCRRNREMRAAYDGVLRRAQRVPKTVEELFEVSLRRRRRYRSPSTVCPQLTQVHN